MHITCLLYSGLISRGGIFEVFVNFALSSKLKQQKVMIYIKFYVPIRWAGGDLLWSGEPEDIESHARQE